MKNIKYFFIGVFAISLLAFQSYAQDMEDTESVKEKIEEEQISFMENFNKGDAKATSEYYAEDAIVAPPNSPEVKGKEAIEKLWQSYIDIGKASVELNTVNTVVSGKLAVVYQAYHFEAMDNDQAIKDDGKSIVVYEQQEDGNWLIIYDTWNSNLPIPGSENK